MLSDRQFLLVEHSPRDGSLLSRTLIRNFPRAKVHHSADPAECLKIARDQGFDAIVVHRATGISSEETVRMFRAAIPGVPIVMISVSDRSESALSAGASRFLLYDEWLMLGQVVSSLLK